MRCCSVSQYQTKPIVLQEIMEPGIITTDEQYRRFLAEVEKLAARDPEPESAEGARLELLARLVEDYEKGRFAFNKADPTRLNRSDVR